MDSLKIMHDLSQGSSRERALLYSMIGSTYNDKRDVYAQAGYPKDGELVYNNFYLEYKRHDIAHRVVTAFPEATWREEPDIKETDDDNETEFEKRFKEITDKLNLYHYLNRADTLANIGQYGVLLLGFDDVSNNQEMKNEVSGASTLNFVQAYGENNATIKEYYSDITSPKFGKPKTYQISIRKSALKGTETQTMEVHESRILHLAERCLENDYIGTSRLEAIYNRLLDLDKILPASAEGFWRSAWPGLAAKKDPNVKWTSDSKDEVSSQFQQFAHGMSRVMRLEGVDIQELSANPASPKDHVYVILELIAGTVNIPRRILTGSEMGEMASTQDRENWHDRVMERRKNWAIPHVIKQLVDKLDNAGVLSKPGNYQIKWDRSQHSERDQTEINKKKATMITTYAKEPNSRSIVSHYDFLKLVFDVDHDGAKEMIKRTKNQDIEIEESNE